MFIYKITVQYNGASYFGWQIQKDVNTIQGELNRALKKVALSDDIYSQGSGRTDAGVHALEQVVKIKIPVNIPVDSLSKALNAQLPMDIRVTSAARCDDKFRPTSDAISKEYHYYFTNKSYASAFEGQLFANISYQLDFEMMKEACSLFMGRHDFKAFMCKGTEVNSTEREIFDCRLEGPRDFGFLFDDGYCFIVKGSGFLKQMVRLMVGSLWDVGRGRLNSENIISALHRPEGTIASVAPASGLYLALVCY